MGSGDELRADPCRYDRLAAGYPEGNDGPEVVLAVGHGLFGNVFSTIVFPLVISFGSIAAAAIMVIVTYLKRQEAAKRAKEEERMIRGEHDGLRGG